MKNPLDSSGSAAFKFFELGRLENLSRNQSWGFEVARLLILCRRALNVRRNDVNLDWCGWEVSCNDRESEESKNRPAEVLLIWLMGRKMDV